MTDDEDRPPGNDDEARLRDDGDSAVGSDATGFTARGAPGGVKDTSDGRHSHHGDAASADNIIDTDRQERTPS